MSEEELDFDDPSFLLIPEVPKAALSYSDQRRLKLQQGRDKGTSHPKSRKQEELERREEGLRTNLIAQDTLEAGDSKALKMMKLMGFKPGEGLGKRVERDDVIEVDGTAGGSQPRTEPIGFEIRSGRTGLGVAQAKKQKISIPTHLLANATTQKLADISSYLDRNKGNFDERKAGGILRSLRRTCEELDRRKGIEDSFRWKELEDPVKVARKERTTRAFMRGDTDPDMDHGVDIAGAREDQDERNRNGGNLISETGLSNTVVDNEDDESEEGKINAALKKEEEEIWFSQDVPTRLALMLDYLRFTYSYCVWCGCQYNDEEDMKNSCPGEDENDH